LLAVLASSGSGAPGGVFTPTLFVGMAVGMLLRSFSGYGFRVRMRRLFCWANRDGNATGGDHACANYVDLMVCEMTGQYRFAARFTDCLCGGVGAVADVTPRLYLPTTRCRA
jgi:CIC family chloride channel protein